MAFILPDEILNKLLCSICKRYLSCAPINIHGNGVISCGRCSTNETPSANSLFEKVARISIFPCINRYEGCNKLLQYQDVAQHEKLCKSTLFSCPLCTSDQSKQITLLYLIDHYKTSHNEYFLEEPKFCIDPSKMSENTYLYCDNYNNCLFLIRVLCTRDRLFLSTSVLNKNVVRRFRLNNILQESSKVILCDTLEESEQWLHVTVAEIISEQLETVPCELVYDVIDKTVPVLVIDVNSVEEPAVREQTLRTLPKIYLDNKFFPEKQQYRLSSCKTKLINKRDGDFGIKLKCDSCDSFFWNISEWDAIKIELDNSDYVFEYGLYRRKMEDFGDLICLQCYRYLHRYHKKKGDQLCKATRAPIFKLRFHCRFGCGMVCFVWELYLHEKNCEFNLEKDCTKYVKKYFIESENSYNNDDLFITGNFIRPFKFEVEFYSFDIFGPNPKLPKSNDHISQEKVIYLITDDGLKCKVYYKYRKGDFCIRVEHSYDRNRYFVRICSEGRFIDDPAKEFMFSEECGFLNLGKSLISTERTATGLSQYVKETPCFTVTLKKNLPSFNVTL